MCAVFFDVSKQWYGCQGFGTFHRVHRWCVIAHRVCVNAVRHSALRVDTGRKLPLLSCPGAMVAQLVERLTEKPGAILRRVRVPGVEGIFLPESTSSADSVLVSIQYSPCPVCDHMHQHLCTC